MRKTSAPANAPFGFARWRTRALRWAGLITASAASLAIGSLSILIALGWKHAVGEGSHPGIHVIPLDAPLSEHGVYPPGIAVGNFDGAYTMATLFKSGVLAENKVALWGSEAGVLQARNYPLDEFVYVLEGDLVTLDADGTRHEFHAGDAFVLPKGWAGTWDMKTRFKKIIVNF